MQGEVMLLSKCRDRMLADAEASLEAGAHQSPLFQEPVQPASGFCCVIFIFWDTDLLRFMLALKALVTGQISVSTRAF